MKLLRVAGLALALAGLVAVPASADPGNLIDNVGWHTLGDTIFNPWTKTATIPCTTDPNDANWVTQTIDLPQHPDGYVNVKAAFNTVQPVWGRVMVYWGNGNGTGVYSQTAGMWIVNDTRDPGWPGQPISRYAHSLFVIVDSFGCSASDPDALVKNINVFVTYP